MSSPLPDHPAEAPQTITPQHSKGSDHDHHRDAEDGRPKRDGRATGASTSDVDRADGPDGGHRSDTVRPRRARQSTAVRRPERAGDGSTPSAPKHPTDAASQRVRAAGGTTRRRPAPARPIPTPEEWAQEQLKNAPERSGAWAAKVAGIYGLQLPVD